MSVCLSVCVSVCKSGSPPPRVRSWYRRHQQRKRLQYTTFSSFVLFRYKTRSVQATSGAYIVVEESMIHSSVDSSMLPVLSVEKGSHHRNCMPITEANEEANFQKNAGGGNPGCFRVR